MRSPKQAKIITPQSPADEIFKNMHEGWKQFLSDIDIIYPISPLPNTPEMLKVDAIRTRCLRMVKQKHIESIAYF